jgi:enamine deaminase RidA (YjgF/YER057c/UK114 family)
MSLIDARLAKLGIELPEAPAPVASYVPAVRTGSLLLVSGQVPFKDGEVLARGPVPSVVPPEDATAAARQCAINGLAVAKAALGGDLERIKRVVRLGVFVQSDDRFDGQPAIANGASELMVAVFGDAGKHARAAVGVNALPLDVSVEIEFTFEVDVAR